MVLTITGTGRLVLPDARLRPNSLLSLIRLKKRQFSGDRFVIILNCFSILITLMISYFGQESQVSSLLQGQDAAAECWSTELRPACDTLTAITPTGL